MKLTSYLASTITLGGLVGYVNAISLTELFTVDILSTDIRDSDAGEAFKKADVVGRRPGPGKRTDPVPEPDPNRPAVTPEFVFVLYCTDDGFQGDCLVFGAPPGDCVSFEDFNPEGSTRISDTYNNNVASLSTNTGGAGQYYLFQGCDNKGDDRGVTLSYSWTLSNVTYPDRPGVFLQDNISSWRA